MTIAIAVFLLIIFIVISKSSIVRNLYVTNVKNQDSTNLLNIKVGNASLSVETAINQEQWSKGLSNISSLPGNRGMLFIFPEKQNRIFWMKETLIPLDLLWIADKKVVGIITMQVEPNKSDFELRKFVSPVAVNAVLETNAGWAGQNAVKIGDLVDY